MWEAKRDLQESRLGREWSRRIRRSRAGSRRQREKERDLLPSTAKSEGRKARGEIAEKANWEGGENIKGAWWRVGFFYGWIQERWAPHDIHCLGLWIPQNPPKEYSFWGTACIRFLLSRWVSWWIDHSSSIICTIVGSIWWMRSTADMAAVSQHMPYQMRQGRLSPKRAI